MPTIVIQPSQPQDLELLFAFYDRAIEYQKRMSQNYWQGFSRAAVAAEIAEQRQYQITVDGTVACIFLISLTDPVIWAGRDADSLYLHRIVTHPDFKGYAFVPRIISWAREYAAARQLKFVRLDTWADNEKLARYYVDCGFVPAGATTLANPPNMPKHYDGIRLSLFEMALT